MKKLPQSSSPIRLLASLTLMLATSSPVWADWTEIQSFRNMPPLNRGEQVASRCDGCPNWGAPGTHSLGGAVQRPACCCDDVPKKWPRLERFEGNAQAPYGGHNTAGYCGIQGDQVEIILSTDNVITADFKKEALPYCFDLEALIIAASLGQWQESPGSGVYGPGYSYVARFSDDFWLKIDLGSYGSTRRTSNASPEARILRRYLDENCGPFQWGPAVGDEI